MRRGDRFRVPASMPVGFRNCVASIEGAVSLGCINSITLFEPASCGMIEFQHPTRSRADGRIVVPHPRTPDWLVVEVRIVGGELPNATALHVFELEQHRAHSDRRDADNDVQTSPVLDVCSNLEHGHRTAAKQKPVHVSALGGCCSSP
jgi:hypothetical protein